MTERWESSGPFLTPPLPHTRPRPLPARPHPWLLPLFLLLGFFSCCICASPGVTRERLWGGPGPPKALRNRDNLRSIGEAVIPSQINLESTLKAAVPSDVNLQGIRESAIPSSINLHGVRKSAPLHESKSGSHVGSNGAVIIGPESLGSSLVNADDGGGRQNDGETNTSGDVIYPMPKNNREKATFNPVEKEDKGQATYNHKKNLNNQLGEQQQSDFGRDFSGQFSPANSRKLPERIRGGQEEPGRDIRPGNWGWELGEKFDRLSTWDDNGVEVPVVRNEPAISMTTTTPTRKRRGSREMKRRDEREGEEGNSREKRERRNEKEGEETDSREKRERRNEREREEGYSREKRERRNEKEGEEGDNKEKRKRRNEIPGNEQKKEGVNGKKGRSESLLDDLGKGKNSQSNMTRSENAREESGNARESQRMKERADNLENELRQMKDSHRMRRGRTEREEEEEELRNELMNRKVNWRTGEKGIGEPTKEKINRGSRRETDNEGGGDELGIEGTSRERRSGRTANKRQGKQYKKIKREPQKEGQSFSWRQSGEAKYNPKESEKMRRREREDNRETMDNQRMREQQAAAKDRQRRRKRKGNEKTMKKQGKRMIAENQKTQENPRKRKGNRKREVNHEAQAKQRRRKRQGNYETQAKQRRIKRQENQDTKKKQPTFPGSPLLDANRKGGAASLGSWGSKLVDEFAAPSQVEYANPQGKRTRKPTTTAGIPRVNPVAAPPWEDPWASGGVGADLNHHTFTGTWGGGGGEASEAGDAGGTMGGVHGAMSGDHSTINSDHGTIGGFHGTLENDHGTMNSVHGTVGGFHSTMNGDHGGFHGIPGGFHGAENGFHGTMEGFQGAMGDLHGTADGVHRIGEFGQDPDYHSEWDEGLHNLPELVHPGGLVDDTHLEDHHLLYEPSGPGCRCYDTTAAFPEMECSCWNVPLTSVPTNFTKNVSRIALNNVGLTTLRNDSFTRYRYTLKEIVLDGVENLRTIEAGAFKGLQHLRSIYIHTAPQLTSMSNLTFNEDNTNLTSIRIANAGLEAIPAMQMQMQIFHMIDLDNNRIRIVHRGSFVVSVEQLSLNYNVIETVEREAFAGSEIGQLSLKGNVELKNLHPEAFKGIQSLRMLDLSETSITSLPTLGLRDLDTLLIERTPSLKVFPSVYSFKDIKTANLTYPYHCCAFQFPETHDPKQYQEFKRKMDAQKECSDITSPPSTLHQGPTIRPRRRSHNSATPTHGHDDPTHRQNTRFQPAGGIPGREEEEERWETLESKGEGVSLSLPGMGGATDGGVNRQGHRIAKRAPQVSQVQRHHRENPSSEVDPSHLRTRHYNHHNRHSRPVTADQTRSLAPGLGNSDDRYRREGQSRIRTNTPGGTHDEAAFTAFPEAQKQRAAALIRETEEEFIPRPEKRIPEESVPEAGEDPFFHQERALGFGAFNHSAKFVPPSKNTNTSSHSWGDGQVWPGHSPPIDSGDDSAYGNVPFPAHDDDGHLLEGGFHPDSGFHPDAGFHPKFPVDGGYVEDGHHAGEAHDGSQWIHAPIQVNKTLEFKCGKVSKDYHSVECHPRPDPFNPCEDIMGNIALRVAVWLVVVTAVVGNLAVMIVLISSKFKMSVSKFLMVNLALADLCMGVYLLIIAAMDLHTIGVYFNYAIDWQNGPGCKVAGFLTVFASELSIFTLTVITSERWYAITYAIHLNKRLKLSMAMKIMVVGWAYSITMAVLPLVGVSSYSKTSICLPMEIGDALALSYLVALLLVNGLAFFVITACYASMYCSISRHDATAPHSDLTVAKRMALLVFTDFACWAPIAFFGLTAVAGLPLINVTRAKILLVFFYPLNSCANPYLYAILTKQYRRDLFILLARYGFCTKRAMKYKGAYSSVNNTYPHNTVVNAPHHHRNSTLTQITLCDLTRGSRTSTQSNNGSLLATTNVGGSQDSLQKNVSPLRTPTKPELASATSENERLSTVQEMSHSNHSEEDDPTDDPLLLLAHSSGETNSNSNLKQQGGSPHPIKNCYTRLSFTPEQEEILKNALQESKAKSKRTSKRSGKGDDGADGRQQEEQDLLESQQLEKQELLGSKQEQLVHHGKLKSPTGAAKKEKGESLAQDRPRVETKPSQKKEKRRDASGGAANQELLATQIGETEEFREPKESSPCSYNGHGGAIVVCEVEIERDRKRRSSPGLQTSEATEEIMTVV